MSKITTGFKARLEYVLDEVFTKTPGGGTHEMRRYVAERLIKATETGKRSVSELMAVGRQAVDDAQKLPKTA